MRPPLLAALLLLLSSALAAAPTSREFEELPPGRYALKLTGLVCAVCARAIAAEWSKLPEVESAEVDYARSRAVITIRLDSTLKVLALDKALRRAERVANLDVHFDAKDFAYQTGFKTDRN